MSDPRVHTLIRTVLDNRGVIVATRSAETITKTVAIPNHATDQFYPQGKLPTEQFMDNLITMAIA